MIGLFQLAYSIIAASCLDSTLPSTREFWRRKVGLPEEVVVDPRPLRMIEVAK